MTREQETDANQWLIDHYRKHRPREPRPVFHGPNVFVVALALVLVITMGAAAVRFINWG